MCCLNLCIYFYTSSICENRIEQSLGARIESEEAVVILEQNNFGLNIRRDKD